MIDPSVIDDQGDRSVISDNDDDDQLQPSLRE